MGEDGLPGLLSLYVRLIVLAVYGTVTVPQYSARSVLGGNRCHRIPPRPKQKGQTFVVRNMIQVSAVPLILVRSASTLRALIQVPILGLMQYGEGTL